jgi:putative transposase
VRPAPLLVLRYVEANGLRAGLVARAADWPWGGLHARAAGGKPFALAEWPVDCPGDWPAVVDAAIDPAELDRLRRRHVNRGQPLGDDGWVAATARRLGLASTLRPIGRPRKVEQ